MANQHLTPAQFRQLTRLSAKLSKIVGLESVAVARDSQTGTFRAGSSISAKSVRAAWKLGGIRRPASSPRDAFKTQLLAALRARSIK